MKCKICKEEEIKDVCEFCETEICEECLIEYDPNFNNKYITICVNCYDNIKEKENKTMLDDLSETIYRYCNNKY